MSPTFIVTSATIANPQMHVKTLLGNGSSFAKPLAVLNNSRGTSFVVESNEEVTYSDFHMFL